MCCVLLYCVVLYFSALGADKKCPYKLWQPEYQISSSPVNTKIDLKNAKVCWSHTLRAFSTNTWKNNEHWSHRQCSYKQWQPEDHISSSSIIAKIDLQNAKVCWSHTLRAFSTNTLKNNKQWSHQQCPYTLWQPEDHILSLSINAKIDLKNAKVCWSHTLRAFSTNTWENNKHWSHQHCPYKLWQPEYHISSSSVNAKIDLKNAKIWWSHTLRALSTNTWKNN